LEVENVCNHKIRVLLSFKHARISFNALEGLGHDPEH